MAINQLSQNQTTSLTRSRICKQSISWGVLVLALNLLRMSSPAFSQPSLAPPSLQQTMAVTAPGLHPAEHTAVRAAAGGWDIENPNGRKCRLQLNPKGTRADLILGVPAPCKMSIPALGPAVLWGLSTNGMVVFKASDGRIISQFERDGSGPLRGNLGADIVTLTPVGGRYPDPARQAAILAATAPPPARIASLAATIQPSPAPAHDKMPGLYIMMRDAGREVCRIMLDAKPATKLDQNRAGFAGNCSDSGLATFDPAAWRIKEGKLFLVARKGHEVGLVYDQGGMWRKDPPTGATLLLKKLN